jgi:toluene monooxygenase system protein A
LNFVIPGPAERKWLRQKYPKYWDDMDAVWEQISERWRTVGPGPANELAVHGTALPTFCDLCQLPLSAGTPRKNTARVLVHDRRKYIFCSEPCQWIFLHEPERYANHKDIVKRVLSGEAPAQLPNLLTEYFNLTPETWGKDVHNGDYEWLGARKDPAA